MPTKLTDEQVEELAKVLWDAEDEYLNHRKQDRTNWDDCPSIWQENFRVMARAVVRELDRMRAPKRKAKVRK